jgi:hypothetical protein
LKELGLPVFFQLILDLYTISRADYQPADSGPDSEPDLKDVDICEGQMRCCVTNIPPKKAMSEGRAKLRR